MGNAHCDGMDRRELAIRSEHTISIERNRHFGKHYQHDGVWQADRRPKRISTTITDPFQEWNAIFLSQQKTELPGTTFSSISSRCAADLD